MDKQQKLNYQRDVEEYLERNNIYNLFEDLTKELIISQPSDCISFLIQKLSEGERKKIFVVGPPGSEVREICLQLSDYLGFNCVSVGDLLNKEVSKKSGFGEQIQQQMKQFRYVDDDLVNQVVVAAIHDLQEENKNVILEGYPKTRLQALHMQRQGIIPHSLILINLDSKGIEEGCEQKLTQGFYNIPEDYQSRMAKAYHQEYTLNISHVKQVYQNNYYEVQVNHQKQKTSDQKDNREEIIENIARLLKYRMRNKQPKRSQRIIVAGPPGSGRTTLAKALAHTYQMQYVSTNQLLMHQIQQNTSIGQTIKSQVISGQLVNDEIMIGLVNERINQSDCKMKGYILDGFPKNINQLYSLEDMRVNPSMVVILEGSEECFLKRVEDYEVCEQTGNKRQRAGPVETGWQKLASHSPEALQHKLLLWREMLKQFEERYAELDFNPIFKVNATPDHHNVFQKVAFHLQNS